MKPNPYVEIVQSPENVSRKTDVRKNTLNPRWGGVLTNNNDHSQQHNNSSSQQHQEIFTL
jgi:hypothetical protein